MATPGTISGTYNFAPSTYSFITEAFSRIKIEPPAITTHRVIEAKNSMNWAFVQLGNRGFNLWKLVTGTINLVGPTNGVGQVVYTFDESLLDLTDVLFTVVNGGGSGINLDRIMVPITRDQYAALPNKLQPGQPSQFWFVPYPVPQMSIYQTSQFAAPNYILTWYGLQRNADANLANGEIPDLVYHAQEAFVACLAWRLAMKFSDMPMEESRKALWEEAWAEFTARDQERGPTIIAPNVEPYARMGIR
jgi:hypothetical protein